MQLDYFKIEKYQDYNIEHRSVLTILDNDTAAKNYLGDLFLITKKTQIANEDNGIDTFYIAYRGNTPIGFCAINMIDYKPFISYGILPEFRGSHLGYLLVNDFSEHLLKEYNFDNVYANVNQKNISSIKSVELAGYKKMSLTRYILPNYY